MAELKYLENEELLGKVQKAAKEYFDDFSTQRKEYETLWEIADYMYRCAQNRTLNDSERAKGMNLGNFENKTELANTGSTLFHRAVNQRASQGMMIQASRDIPFKYMPIINSQVFYSEEEVNEQTEQRNVLARWTMKTDKFNQKSIEFWYQLEKYGNQPIMIYQKQRTGKRKIRRPKYRVEMDMAGNSVPVADGFKETEKEMTIENYPSLKLIPIDSFYADVNIGNIQGQDCIIIFSLNNMNYFWQGVADDYFSEDAVKKISGKEKWDGAVSDDVRKTRLKNKGIDTVPNRVTDLYSTFDIFMRSPIEDDKWNDEGATRNIYWITVIGNDIRSGVAIRFEENPDPDKEFPVEMIHARPDDDDNLYHMSSAQVVRSNYSVECTLKNQAIDNGGLMNRPPLQILEGAVRGKDFTFRPDQTFIVESMDAIREMEVRDTTARTVNLLEYVSGDTRMALELDKSFVGMEYGERTSALEARNLQQGSLQPHLIRIRYVLEQYLGFYARKLPSYWKAFAEDKQIVAITDELPYPVVYPKDLFGEFDIEINIVDEFEDDVLTQRKIDEALQLIGNSPAYAQYVDIAELLSEWFRRRKINPAKIIRRPMDADAAEIARQENILMMENGVYVGIKPGENSSLHLPEHEGERLRYKGIEQQYPTVKLLDQHLLETKMAISQKQTQQQAPLPAPTPPQTAGQMVGGELGGALGGMR